MKEVFVNYPILTYRASYLLRTFWVFACLLMSVLSMSGAVWYVSPTGSDAQVGSLEAPFAGIQRAQTAAQPGDTVYLRGGVYQMAVSQVAQYKDIWAYVHLMNKSGLPSAPIRYWAYPGELPVFDFSAIKPQGYRVTAFQVDGSYLHFKGFEVVGVQVTILEHTQSECFRNQGSHNTYEQLAMHDGQAIGFYLTKGSDNLVLNCDAYNNADVTSEDKKGGNTDGFGGHPAKGSVGNVFRGCRAWFNSDDGFDCISAAEAMIIDQCWAYGNGYTPAYVSMRDGNGFKVGGHGAAPTSIDNLPAVIPSHTVTRCLAYRNKANGFYANHHVETGNTWLNNTAYKNKVNFNMLSQRIVYPGTDSAYTEDVPGIRHILHNNLSYSPVSAHVSNMGTSTETHNSFSAGMNLSLGAGDFESALETVLMAGKRQADGGLPLIGFMRPKAGADQVDKGMDVGLPFSGTAPDLGAFEWVDTSTVSKDVVYDDPNSGVQTSDVVPFFVKLDGVGVQVYLNGYEAMHPAKARLYDTLGRLCLNTNFQSADQILRMTFLPAGYYLLRLDIDGQPYTSLIPWW